MYKGKFDAKRVKSDVAVEELVSQRNSAAAKRPAKQAAAEAPTVRKAPAAQIPAEKPVAPAKSAPKQAAEKAPVKQSAENSGAKKGGKKGPRTGTVIFYTFYFMFILLFFLATYLGLNWLHGWLSDYEAAQPTAKCTQVFDQLFSDPDWGYLYDAAGAEATTYEGKEEFVAYMEQKVGEAELTYLETSAGLSGDKKYLVKLGNETVASFTLTKSSGAADATDLTAITDIPEWTLGTIEVFFEGEQTYYIEMMDGHTAYVNDIPLTEDDIVQIATTKAEEYLPIGVTGFRMCTLEVSGLMSAPTVTVFDKDGTQMEVTYDETTATFTERTEANTITDEQKNVAIEAAQTYSKWMIEEVSSRAVIAKYFKTSSDVYSEIIKTTELWMQGHSGYRFLDIEVKDYARYSDELFSVRVSMNLNVTRKDGTTRDYEFNKTMFFELQESGKWLCYAMTNVDTSEPVGQVRLTFMDGTTRLTSGFCDTDADTLTTPLVSVPEGKVFGGWYRIDEDENGVVSYTVVFTPDESGNVTIPSGTTLEPMVLYALYENASAEATEAGEGA